MNNETEKAKGLKDNEVGQSEVDGVVIKPCPFCATNGTPKHYDETPWNIYIERKGLQMAWCDDTMGGCGMGFLVKADSFEEAIKKLNERV